MPSKTVQIKRRVSPVTGKITYTTQFLSPDGVHWIGAGTYDAKKLAEFRVRAAYEASRKPGWVDPRGGLETLGVYVERVFWQSRRVSGNTLSNYRSVYRTHIEPKFGSRSLSSVTPGEIDVWLNDLHRSDRTRQLAYTVLNMIFRDARRNHVIPANPCDDVERPQVLDKPVEIFTESMWPKFWACVPSEFQPLVWVAVRTGMRQSEIRGLCPAQIKWASREVNVDRAIIEVGEDFPPSARVVKREGPYVWLDRTKGKTHRLVSLSGDTMTHLDGEPAIITLGRILKQRGLADNSTEEFFPRYRRTDFAKMMAAACKEAGLPRRTFHDIRATYASWRLVETGGDLMRVMRELGHKDVKTTQRYLAVVRDVEVDERASFEALMAEIAEYDKDLGEAQTA